MTSRKRSAEVSRTRGGPIDATGSPPRVTSNSSPAEARVSMSAKFLDASLAVILAMIGPYQIFQTRYSATIGAQPERPNQRARRLEPKWSFSARSAADGSWKVPVGAGPEKKSTSTRPIRPAPNST